MQKLAARLARHAHPVSVGNGDLLRNLIFLKTPRKQALPLLEDIARYMAKISRFRESDDHYKHRGQIETLVVGCLASHKVTRFIQVIDIHLNGFAWREVGARPADGKELKSPTLAAALTVKARFTPEEWEAFHVRGLLASDFIQAGAKYFQPVMNKVSVLVFQNYYFELIFLLITTTTHIEDDLGVLAERRHAQPCTPPEEVTILSPVEHALSTAVGIVEPRECMGEYALILWKEEPFLDYASKQEECRQSKPMPFKGTPIRLQPIHGRGSERQFTMGPDNAVSAALHPQRGPRPSPKLPREIRECYERYPESVEFRAGSWVFMSEEEILRRSTDSHPLYEIAYSGLRHMRVLVYDSDADRVFTRTYRSPMHFEQRISIKQGTPQEFAAWKRELNVFWG